MSWLSNGLSRLASVFAPRTEPRSVSVGTDFSRGYQPDVILQSLITLGREHSPQDVIGYRRSARAGDPRRYYEFLDEARRLVLAPPLERLYDGVEAAAWLFSCPVDGWDDVENLASEAALAREIRDYERAQWEPWIPTIARTKASAWYYGIAGARLETEVRGAAKGRERISLVDPIPARRFKVDPVSGRWVVQPHVFGADWRYVDELVETGELLFWEVDPQERLDQRGYGWTSYIPWVIAQYDLRWFSLKIELAALPPRTGEYDPSIQGHKELVEAALEKQAAKSWVAYPAGSKIGFADIPQMGGTNDPHQTLWETAKREIYLVILGHAQAMEVRVGGGSVQSSNDAQAVVDARINKIARRIAEGPLSAAVRRSVQRNFGPEAAATFCPKVTARLAKPEDPLVLSQIALNLKNAGAGHKVSADDLVRRCLGRVAKADEATLADVPSALPASALPLKAGALEALFGSATEAEDAAERAARLAKPAAINAMEPLFAAIDRATDGDDLETIGRQLRGLSDVIATAALEAGVAGVSEERAALRRLG